MAPPSLTVCVKDGGVATILFASFHLSIQRMKTEERNVSFTKICHQMQYILTTLYDGGTVLCKGRFFFIYNLNI